MSSAGFGTDCITLAAQIDSFTYMSSAGSSVAMHVRVLRGCGFLRGSRGSLGARGWHDAYRAATLALTGAYLAQECVYAFLERGDMEELARVMFLLLCHVTSLVKQLVFHADADRIDRLIAALDGARFNQRAAGARGLRARCARRAARLVRLYAGAAVLTCALWAALPALHRARGARVQFPFWVSFDYSTGPRFALVLAYSYYVTTLVGIANTTMDAFIATILSQCKTQLTILRMNLEDLPERARSSLAPAPAVECYERALDALLRESLAHYEQICQTTRLVQDIFGTAILVQFGIGGWILCMAAYKIVSLNVLSMEFASMTLFICCILTELFLYCYYGNEVAVESSLVAGAVYSMQWRRTPRRFQRALLVVMQRAQRPLRPAAGLVIPLSLETFIKVPASPLDLY